MAEEVAATASSRRSWRKVTTLLDRFGINRLTTAGRHRIGEALDEAGLVVEPPMTEVERYGTVRLSLRAPQPVETKTSSPTALDDAIQATIWEPRQPPRKVPLSGARAGEGVLWLDVDISQVTEPSGLLAALQPLCEHRLTKTMVEDLLDADPRPKVHAYTDDGCLRCVSSFAIREEEEAEGGAESDNQSKAGNFIIQPVEFLAEERWIISCWHRAHATRDGADEIRDDDSRDISPSDLTQAVRAVPTFISTDTVARTG